MSSVNQFPTFHYSQPEDYRFSHDSVFLGREVFEKHRNELSHANYKILDLCAGCGIVGLDLLFHQLKEEKNFHGEIDFLEIQEIYKIHFEENKKRLQKEFPQHKLNLNWIQKNYAEAQSISRYDLIVCNPPYFLPNTGLLSDNEFKNRCRFFLDAGWEEMIAFIETALKEGGKAYFLVRDELKKTIERELHQKIKFPSQIRGTWLAIMEKIVSGAPSDPSSESSILINAD